MMMKPLRQLGWPHIVTVFRDDALHSYATTGRNQALERKWEQAWWAGSRRPCYRARQLRFVTELGFNVYSRFYQLQPSGDYRPIILNMNFMTLFLQM